MHITTCTTCGELYEETSEEVANAPIRECGICWAAEVMISYAPADHPEARKLALEFVGLPARGEA